MRLQFRILIVTLFLSAFFVNAQVDEDNDDEKDDGTDEKWANPDIVFLFGVCGSQMSFVCECFFFLITVTNGKRIHNKNIEGKINNEISIFQK